MKKIININLSSRLIPIEDTAYDLLKSYLDDLKRHFGREEGGEEIVSDIEDRIAEVFQDKLKKGAHCITDEDVSTMINAMGRPEQLEEETASEPQSKPASAAGAQAPPKGNKRLIRDESDKILGGVCSGLAAFLGIDPVIVRIITFLLIWAWGFGLLIYIVLWLVLPSSQSLKNPIHKRLYRNPDNKVIGGVASGIAAYLNIDPVIPRILFVLPLMGIIFTSIFHHWVWFPGFFFPLSVGSLPTLIVLYIVLWISVPKAKTVTEKLEMRGEKVDIQSIANAMKGEEKKNESVTPQPIGETVPQPERTPASAYPGPEPRRGSGAGAFIALLFKICAYFILGIVVICICVALIGIAGGFIGAAGTSTLMLPYKDLLLHGSSQHILAWPAILLTLGIPVVAIIWLFLKLVTGFRPQSRVVGISLFSLWIIGVICAICLCISVVKDFRMRYREATQISIQQPSAGGLLLTETPSSVSIGGWDMLDDFIEVGDDTAILKSVSLRLYKSRDDSFHLEVQRCSNGHSVSQARNYARSIDFNITQEDSVVYIPDGFPLPRQIPFRNQHLILRLYVPVGKRIQIDESLRKLRHSRHWSNDDWSDDDHFEDAEDWNYNNEYQMTKDGLEQSVQQIDDTVPTPPEPKIDSGNKKKTSYRYKGTTASNASY